MYYFCFDLFLHVYLSYNILLLHAVEKGSTERELPDADSDLSKITVLSSAGHLANENVRELNKV